MFGYLHVAKEQLSPGEYGLYHAFFCGLCVSTKKQFGNLCRLATNYDINLFHVLFHSFLQQEVSVYQSTCVASPFKKRSILTPSELTDRLAAGNVLLMYANLYDDVQDEGSPAKKIAFRAFRPYYKKAKKLCEKLEEDIRNTYHSLRKLEKAQCGNLDEVCHPFAEMSRLLAKDVLGDRCNEYMENLCYNLGKWVYLIDALDDLEKDAKKKTYNPLISSLGNYQTASQFVQEQAETLQFVFYTALNKIAECFNDLELTQYVCILKNVLYVSIRQKTKEVLEKYLPKQEEAPSAEQKE